MMYVFFLRSGESRSKWASLSRKDWEPPIMPFASSRYFLELKGFSLQLAKHIKQKWVCRAESVVLQCLNGRKINKYEKTAEYRGTQIRCHFWVFWPRGKDLPCAHTTADGLNYVLGWRDLPCMAHFCLGIMILTRKITK